MALVKTTSGPLLLELNGQAAGGLRRVQPANLRVTIASSVAGRETVVRRGAQVALGEMSADAYLFEPGPLVDWLQMALADDLTPRNGAVLQGDANLNLRRRIDFRGARLSGLSWPALDATDAKQALILSLRWLVESVDDTAGSGGKIKQTTSRRKPPQTSNFRVSGLPFGGDAVLRVALPELQVAWATDRVGEQRRGMLVGRRQLGEAAITIGARQAEAARTWVHKLVADGSIDEREGLTLQVDLLDAALKNVLATVVLNGCLLSGMDEDPLATGSEKLGNLTLRFDVAGMTLQVV